METFNEEEIKKFIDHLNNKNHEYKCLLETINTLKNNKDHIYLGVYDDYGDSYDLEILTDDIIEYIIKDVEKRFNDVKKELEGKIIKKDVAY